MLFSERANILLKVAASFEERSDFTAADSEYDILLTAAIEFNKLAVETTRVPSSGDRVSQPEQSRANKR